MDRSRRSFLEAASWTALGLAVTPAAMAIQPKEPDSYVSVSEADEYHRTRLKQNPLNWPRHINCRCVSMSFDMTESAEVSEAIQSEVFDTALSLLRDG